jgi:hypothetical protein
LSFWKLNKDLSTCVKFFICASLDIFLKCNKFLNLTALDQNTSKIVASHALPLTYNDIYFLTREWTKMHNVINYAATNGLLDFDKMNAIGTNGRVLMLLMKDILKCSNGRARMDQDTCSWAAVLQLVR